MNTDFFLKYNSTGAQIFSTSQVVKRVDNCNGFLAVNTGAVIVRINDHILYPGTPGTIIGESFTEGGNRGEIFLGNIKIVFDAGAGAECTVDQKFYVLDEVIR